MEHVNFIWAIFIILMGAAAGWGGAAWAIKSYDTRITKLEDKVEKLVPITVCREARVDCKDAALTGSCQIQEKLENLFNMFRDLEERRNERWEEFEIRRETAKDDLQRTLLTMTGQIKCLEGVITERSKSFRTDNGKPK
jgi:hypothetical protein